jgi:S-adenosylmethionine synthetase
MNKNMITVKQVSKYHPDKYADQISDNIVAYALRINPKAKVSGRLI